MIGVFFDPVMTQEEEEEEEFVFIGYCRAGTMVDDISRYCGERERERERESFIGSRV